MEQERMNKLTINNLIEAEKIKGDFEQQIFLLSIFKEISQEEIANAPITEIMPMMHEMGRYLEDGLIEKKSAEEKITNRSEILDLR